MGTRSKAGAKAGRKRESRKDKVFSKDVPLQDGGTQELKLDYKTLMEGFMPSLSKDQLMIPGFNCTLTQVDDKLVPLPMKGKPTMKIYFLSPFYEQKLMDLIAPLIEELKDFIGEFGTEDGGFNWEAQLGPLLSSLTQRLITSLGDFAETLAVASSIVCEASIVLHRKYSCEELTEEDQKNIDTLNANYFIENVPSDFMLKNIVIPQYVKTSIADALSLFFSTILNLLSVGMGNLIQKGTSLITAGSAPSPSSETSMNSSTITAEPNSL